MTPTRDADRIRVPNPLTDSLTTARAIQDALGKLKVEDADQIRSLLKSTPDADAKRDLERLTSLEAFKKASGPTMVAILTQLAADTREERNSGMRWVLKEPNFEKLTAAEQVAIVELVGNDRSGRLAEPLAKLLSRDGQSGKPIIQSTDSKGSTVLDNLVAHNNATFHADVAAAGITPKKTIVEITREIGDPVHSVDQGNRGACAAASIQDVLCRLQPAEYVRLTTGLMVSTTVEARGGTLKVAEGSLVAAKDKVLNSPDMRSHGERIFQSALLDNVSTLGKYSYATDGTLVLGAFDLGGGGMSVPEMGKAMAVVFGKGDYEFVKGSGSEVHAALKASSTPSVISMKWETGLHALVYVKSDDKFVYLKDPNGSEPDPSGKPSREPISTGADANIRLRIDVFEANLRDAHIKRTVASSAPPATPDPAVPVDALRDARQFEKLAMPTLSVLPGSSSAALPVSRFLFSRDTK